MSNIKDELGNRMKSNYEAVTKYKLTRRVPVIIRIDGRAFHTFTKGMNKPFDKLLMGCMIDTMYYLCNEIQGCVFGYTQSDEITLVLTDYNTITTEAWFKYDVQKLASVSASMATMKFNSLFNQRVSNIISAPSNINDTGSKYCRSLKRSLEKGATFDSRSFNCPVDEVCNLIYWRQVDAIRNSIESAGRAFYSSKELYKKSCENIKEMLRLEKGVEWDSYPTSCKHGTSCKKDREGKFFIDYDMPLLLGESRRYIEDVLNKDEI